MFMLYPIRTVIGCIVGFVFDVIIAIWLGGITTDYILHEVLGYKRGDRGNIGMLEGLRRAFSNTPGILEAEQEQIAQAASLFWAWRKQQPNYDPEEMIVSISGKYEWRDGATWTDSESNRTMSEETHQVLLGTYIQTTRMLVLVNCSTDERQHSIRIYVHSSNVAIPSPRWETKPTTFSGCPMCIQWYHPEKGDPTNYHDWERCSGCSQWYPDYAAYYNPATGRWDYGSQLVGEFLYPDRRWKRGRILCRKCRGIK